MLGSVAWVAIGPIWREKLSLEGFLGFEPRVVELKLTIDYPRKKCRLILKECGPCPVFTRYTMTFALQLRKITENVSQG